MRFRVRRPEYDEIDGEYVVPVRLSEEATHSMIGGWYPMGIGYMHLRTRKDGSFDLFVKPPTAEDINAVPLDRVGTALMAALDLAVYILQDEDVSEELQEAAGRIRELVSATGQ